MRKTSLNQVHGHRAHLPHAQPAEPARGALNDLGPPPIPRRPRAVGKVREGPEVPGPLNDLHQNSPEISKPPRDRLGLALACAHTFLNPEVLSRDLDRALDHPNQVGCPPCTRSRDSLLRQEAIRGYPIRKVTTPVPVEGGVAGGALPMSAGTSFHGRRKPNGSACQRRTMAGVQEEDAPEPINR
jgi:hypothetical protein